MGPATATVAEPVLFLQPTYAGAQERETNGSWANAGAFCAGAAVAAGAVALASAQSKRVATLGTGGNVPGTALTTTFHLFGDKLWHMKKEHSESFLFFV